MRLLQIYSEKIGFERHPSRAVEEAAPEISVVSGCESTCSCCNLAKTSSMLSSSEPTDWRPTPPCAALPLPSPHNPAASAADNKQKSSNSNKAVVVDHVEVGVQRDRLFIPLLAACGCLIVHLMAVVSTTASSKRAHHLGAGRAQAQPATERRRDWRRRVPRAGGQRENGRLTQGYNQFFSR